MQVMFPVFNCLTLVSNLNGTRMKVYLGVGIWASKRSFYPQTLFAQKFRKIGEEIMGLFYEVFERGDYSMLNQGYAVPTLQFQLMASCLANFHPFQVIEFCEIKAYILL